MPNGSRSRKGVTVKFNFERRDKERGSNLSQSLDTSKRNYSDLSSNSSHSSSADSFDSAQSPSKKQRPPTDNSPMADPNAMNIDATHSGGSAGAGVLQGATGSTGDSTTPSVVQQTPQSETFADNLLLSLSRPDVCGKISELFKTSCIEIITTLQSNYEALRLLTVDQSSQITELQRENKKLQSNLDEANEKVNELEQYDRRDSLVISNPNWNETPGEDTDDMVYRLAWEIGVSLPPWAISRSHRLGRGGRNTPRPILVKFSGYRPREALWNARDRLVSSRVFINEDLTAKNSELFYAARMLKKQGHIDSALTRDGKIFVNKYAGDRLVKIKNATELNEVATKSSFSDVVNRPASSVDINERLLNHAGMPSQQRPLTPRPPMNLPPQQRHPAPRPSMNQPHYMHAAPRHADPRAAAPAAGGAPPPGPGVAPAAGGLNAGASSFAPSSASTPIPQNQT